MSRKLKQNLVLFILVPLLFGCVSAYKPKPEPTKIERPHLYLAHKKDLTIFILGTFHIGVDLSELWPFIEEQFKSSALDT